MTTKIDEEKQTSNIDKPAELSHTQSDEELISDLKIFIATASYEIERALKCRDPEKLEITTRSAQKNLNCALIKLRSYNNAPKKSIDKKKDNPTIQVLEKKREDESTFDGCECGHHF
jgi:hypothetical protein